MADSCRTGAATNVIFGLALGYKSVIILIFAIAISIFVSFSLVAMYGIVVAALGMLSTIATGLAIDSYGLISDNAGGITEMARMSHKILERTDALDAAGNTTAAIGKALASEMSLDTRVNCIAPGFVPTHFENFITNNETILTVAYMKRLRVKTVCLTEWAMIWIHQGVSSLGPWTDSRW